MSFTFPPLAEMPHERSLDNMFSSTNVGEGASLESLHQHITRISTQ